ncbi:hypothetical protein EDB85DRAFT_1893159 [Lactarius pseudohatsudake]|nr:hypothetical protein EDB85DRAFT_1893159 [Lactarius pseudohatsudake]
MNPALTFRKSAYVFEMTGIYRYGTCCNPNQPVQALYAALSLGCNGLTNARPSSPWDPWWDLSTDSGGSEPRFELENTTEAPRFWDLGHRELHWQPGDGAGHPAHVGGWRRGARRDRRQVRVH